MSIARTASPVYSNTWPVPPPTPILAIRARITSLAETPGASRPSMRTSYVLRPVLQQALRREHVLDLARADAEGQRAEGAVRRRVAVAAHDRHARLRVARARGRSRARCPAARCPARSSVIPNSRQLSLSCCSCLRARSSTTGPRVGIAVVHGGDRALGPPHPEAARAQAAERLGRGHLVDEVDGRCRGSRGESGSCATTCASQIFWNRVRRSLIRLPPPVPPAPADRVAPARAAGAGRSRGGKRTLYPTRHGSCLLEGRAAHQPPGGASWPARPRR